MDRNPLRKPKLYFDTASQASHVTFDDRIVRRNIPWHHFVEARWLHAEPDLICLEIGEWLVLVRGHNLGPLFQAIEDRALTRLRAQPELAEDREHEPDTFVTDIRFLAPPVAGLKPTAGGQIELNLAAD